MDESAWSNSRMIMTRENRCTLRKTCPSATLYTTNPSRSFLGLHPFFQQKKFDWSKSKIHVSTTKTKFSCLWCHLHLGCGKLEDQVFGVQSRYTSNSDRTVEDLNWKKGASRDHGRSGFGTSLGSCIILHAIQIKYYLLLNYIYVQMLLNSDSLIRTAFCTLQHSDCKNKVYSVRRREKWTLSRIFYD